MKVIHKPAELYPKPSWWDHVSNPKQIITINWHSQDNLWWNETCADVLEIFGLPGNRFYYKPYPTHMTFTFKSLKDAELCRLLLSEKL
jgi:hypothetical protein